MTILRKKAHKKSTHLKNRGFTLMELILVVIIIAILAIVFLNHANNIVEKAERAALESISRSFASSMGSLRGKWVVEGSNQPAVVVLDSQAIYLNEFGWPANTNADSDASSNSQTPEECQQLWEVISQSPIPATTNPGQRGTQRLHISVVNNTATSTKNCRFELAATAPATHYFDYNLKTGRVDIQLPPLKPSN